MADGLAALAGLPQSTLNALSIVAQITDQYPAFAPLLQIPEIASILIEASKPGAQWTTPKLQAAIQASDWWKTNSDSNRAWQVTKLVNPGTAAEKQAQSATDIMHAAATAGITLTPSQLAQMSENANAHSWTAAQIQQNIGSHAALNNLRPGTIQADATRLGGIAADYGVPLSSQSAFTWAQRINEGTATSDGFTAYAIQQAKLHFPTLAEHLDQGMTVRQLADPYMQIAGQTLGVDPNSLELSDPRWAAALQHRDEKGNIVGPMTTLDWQRKIMTDPGYGYDHTANAQAAATNLVQQLGQAFGVVKT